MTIATGASYGYPPLTMQDMSVGGGYQPHPLAHPAKLFGFSAYAVILIGVAALYFWKGRK